MSIDFSKIFEHMKEAQGQVKSIREAIEKIQVTEETGAGLVKVCMSGNKKLLKIDIDDTLLHIRQKQMLQDLIIGAINLAVVSSEKHAKEILRSNTNDLMKNLPLDVFMQGR